MIAKTNNANQRILKATVKTLEELRDNLCQLNSSGSGGFEGLIRDLFEQFLGRSIYLMKSGTQGGGDAYSGSFPNQLTLVWEDKLYDQKTPLPVDQLQAKLIQACFKYPEMDIWLLITTKEISAQHIRDLEEVAQREGVGVLVIDWPANQNRLSKLALLAAHYRDILSGYQINLSDSLVDDLKNNPQFQPQLAVLKSFLITPQLSYLFLKNTAKEQLEKAFVSRIQAKEQLGCYGNVNSKDSFFIERTTINRQLNEWWQEPQKTFALVHGKEGRGKSWAVFRWISQNIDLLPLTLVIPARKLVNLDIEKEIALALERITGSIGKNSEYFHKRVSRIRKHAKKSVKILIVFDGLNQNYNLTTSYEELLLSLLTEDWNFCVKVILTSRSGYLAKCNFLKAIEEDDNNIQRLQRIEVKEFSYEEQQKFLKANNLQKNDFETGVLRLLAVPRYADMVVKHSLELKNAQNCTIEHLFLLDWKDRLNRDSATKSISNNDFLTIIHDLAVQFYQQRTGKEKGFRIGDLRTTVISNINLLEKEQISFIDELAQDTWLMQSEKPGLFKLKPEMAPTALALVLNDQLKNSEQMQEAFNQFIEPMNGVDQISQIVFSAIRLNLIGNKFDLAKFLCSEFLSLQNHHFETIENFYRIIFFSSSFYFNLLEEKILQAKDFQTIDFLKKSLLWACRVSRTKELETSLREQLNLWLGQANLVLRTQTDTWIDSLRKEREENVDLNSLAGQGYEIKFISPTGGLQANSLSILSNVGLQMSSQKGIINWFLCHYLAPLIDRKRLAWLLRWDANQDFVAKLEGKIEKMDGLSEKAKKSILTSLATLSCQPELAKYVTSPEQNHLICRMEMELARKAKNPEYKFNSEEIELGDNLVEKMNLSEFNQYASVTSAESTYEYLRFYLARTDSIKLAELESQIYRTSRKNSLKERNFSCRQLQESLLIMTDIEEVNQDFESILTNVDLLKQNPNHNQHMQLIYVGFCKLNWIDQFKFLSRLPEDFSLSSDLEYVIDGSDFDRETFKKILFEASEDTQKANILHFGLRFEYGKLDNELEDFFMKSCLSTCTRLHSIVTAWALRWGSNTILRDIANRLLQGNTYLENLDNPSLFYFFLHISDKNLKEIENWCHPKFFPIVIKRRGYKEIDIEEFALLIYEYIEGMGSNKRKFNGKHWSWHFSDQNDEVVFDRIIQKEARIIDATEKFINSSKIFTAFDTFPFEDLIPAIWKCEPQKGLKIWLILQAKLKESASFSKAFEMIPFRVAANYDKALLTIFENANTDLELFHFCYHCHQYDKKAFLLKVIKECLESERIVLKAKGLILLGYCEEAPEWQVLWNCKEFSTFNFGWLKLVKDSALNSYQKGKWAKFWHKKFVEAKKETEAFANFLLFQECFDMRCWLWLPDQWIKDSKNIPPLRRMYFELQNPKFRQIVDKNNSKLKDTFGDERISIDMCPWWK